MARPGDRRPGADGEPRPNVLAEGNPVPNVLHGVVPGRAPSSARREPAAAAGPTRRWSASRADQAAADGAPRAEGRAPVEPARRRASLPGCGCGGWAVLLGLLFLVTRLVGACDDVVGPETTSPPVEAPAGATVDVDQLEPGDCFSWIGEADQVATVAAVDCPEAHDAEVTGLVELPDPPDAAYDAEAVIAAAEERCDAAMTGYAGGPAPVGRRSSYIYPGAEGWQQGDRTVVCLAEGAEAGTLTGSVRATDAP
jgi:hypothetical protein